MRCFPGAILAMASSRRRPWHNKMLLVHSATQDGDRLKLQSSQSIEAIGMLRTARFRMCVKQHKILMQALPIKN
jgi:hypothetical protein